MAMGTGMTVVDVSVIHPAGAGNRFAAARNDGAAAARRDADKRRTYNRLDPNGYPFVPFSIESYGRLGRPAIALLARLGAEAAGVGDQNWVSKSAFVRSALRELSVGLCMGNCVMYRKALGLRAIGVSQGFRPGSDRPTAEVQC